MDAVVASLRCSVSPTDEHGLRRDFHLPEHHIPHRPTHKSPCSAHLKAPLAFGSVNLFVVCLSNENSNWKCLDGIELWSDANCNFQWASQCQFQVFIKLAGTHNESLIINENVDTVTNVRIFSL